MEIVVLEWILFFFPCLDNSFFNLIVTDGLGASGLIISYPLGTFFSSLEGRNMINPDALEAGPYPDRRIDEKMCR